VYPAWYYKLVIVHSGKQQRSDQAIDETGALEMALDCQKAEPM
jgi:hypothetical protein